MEGCASSGSRAPPRPHAHAACICMVCAYWSTVEVDRWPITPSTAEEREPSVVPAFLAHATALAAMALAHLDPYRRSRRDAARALARTARRCAAHSSFSPRTSSAPSTALVVPQRTPPAVWWLRHCQRTTRDLVHTRESFRRGTPHQEIQSHATERMARIPLVERSSRAAHAGW